MRIALLSDVHANREALSACLAHAQACSVYRHIFLGDYVGYGADPGWAVDTVAAISRQAQLPCSATTMRRWWAPMRI